MATKTKAAGSTVAAVAKQLQTDHGPRIGGRGYVYDAHERVPTGIFDFDVATGGGFPRGATSIIYGPEGASKTTLALRAIGQHQILWPDKQCVFFDIENTFDPMWAKAHGVDVDALYVMRPTFAEEAVDMAEAFAYADDCGVICVDSLATFLPVAEYDNDAGKGSYGGSSIVVGRLCRKLLGALREAAKTESRVPTVMFINQVRHRMGVMFGSPETTPGGNAPKFMASLTIRVYGKDEKDATVSKVMPATKKVTMIVQKTKVPILAYSAEWSMVLAPHKGLRTGAIDDWSRIKDTLQGRGYLEKADGKQGWVFNGETYQTLEDVRSFIYEDPARIAGIRYHLIREIADEEFERRFGDDAEAEGPPAESAAELIGG